MPSLSPSGGIRAKLQPLFSTLDFLLTMPLSQQLTTAQRFATASLCCVLVAFRVCCLFADLTDPQPHTTYLHHPPLTTTITNQPTKALVVRSVSCQWRLSDTTKGRDQHRFVGPGTSHDRWCRVDKLSHHAHDERVHAQAYRYAFPFLTDKEPSKLRASRSGGAALSASPSSHDGRAMVMEY